MLYSRVSLLIAVIAVIPFLSSFTYKVGDLSYAIDTSVSSEDISDSSINLMVSLIWEGDHLLNHNLAAIDKFRKKFPNLRLTQLISPSYFTKPGVNLEATSKLIKQHIKPQDDVGIYLQPWKSLVEDAGVIFRNGPTYWGNTILKSECNFDCGREIPLSVYHPDDIDRIVQHAKKLIVQNGLGSPKIFAAGGWLSSQEIMESIAKQGFHFDVSAIPPFIVKRRLEEYPIYRWLNHRWHYMTPITQPHYITTSSHNILEIGNSGGVVDLLTVEEMTNIFLKQTAVQRKTKTPNLIFHVSMHQETAQQFLPRLEALLLKIREIKKQNNILVKPLVLTYISKSIRNQ